MTKRIQAKHKISRRYKVDLWGQPGSPVHVRAYPPGQHGNKGNKKLTEYGHQLAAKQKLKGYYGNIVEKQFRNIYEKAARMPGDTGENLLILLERRLDAVVYRLKIAPTVFSARQIINHRHILVNGKCVNIASYVLKDGDTVSLREGMRQNPLIINALASPDRQVPEYLEFNASSFTGKLLYAPDPVRIPYPVQMNVHSVIECYAR